MNKLVSYPDHVTDGIKKNHRAYPLPSNLRLFGADTETVHGEPHTVQAWEGPDGPILAASHVLLENMNSFPPDRRPWLAYVTKKTILPAFWGWVRPRMREGGVNVCYFHRLKFDTMILFSDHHLNIYEQGGRSEFFLESDGRPLKKKLADEWERSVVRVEILFGKVNMASLTEGVHYMEEGELRFRPIAELKILDSLAFTQAGLARSLKMFLIPQNKMKQPDGLGKVPIRTPEFEEYAKQDVVAEWYLGRKIMEIHAKYQVRPSVSLPQFISRVFRHDFFHPGDVIAFPPTECAKAAEFSYHGGKNGLYCEPGEHEDVTEVDINSAYPWAMRELPSFLSGNYRRVDAWAGPGYAGVYLISGETDPAAVYPLVFDHEFRRVDGAFTDLWNTSYEVERMLQVPFVKIKKISGWIWEPGPIKRNPFADFVEEFYRLKQETPRDDPYYHFYKIALNSLYGKLISVIEERELMELPTDDGGDVSVKLDYRFDSALGRYVKTNVENVAGAMYNPFICSLITGKVRALLFDLETKYKALHSSTDSIKTRMRPAEVDGLGGWKEECFGRCWIFRNKLYLHFKKNDPILHDFKGSETECEICKKPRRKHIRDRGQSLEKYALHAYKGTPEDLFKNRVALLRDGKMEYDFTHVVGLREGLRRKETPGDFVQRKETLLLKRGSRG